MGKRELEAVYGPNKMVRLVQKAIRHEAPGGDKLLDLLELVHKIRMRKEREEETETTALLQTLETRIHEIRSEMAEYILRKYDSED